jgi:WD40 repeat protein
MEHTKAVNDAKWNTNNKDEFATVSDDGLLKIWDRRTADQSSVNTLMDRTDPAPLSCVDWHKKDVYT